jgi:hypothetical protein
LGAVSFADGRAVFIEGDIPDIVEAVFDRPVAPGQAEEAGGVRFLWSQTGEAIDDFGAFFLRNDFRGISLNTEDLSGVGEGQIPVQFRTGPDVADFQATVGFIGGGMVRGEKPLS